MPTTLLARAILSSMAIFSGIACAGDIACCGVGPLGQPVINADQTVIIIWDPVKKIEHFIRQASFKTEAADFGFLIPTPTQPELAESGNETFPFLANITKPEVETRYQFVPSIGCGDSDGRMKSAVDSVNVLDEKLVAGFNAVVLEASSAKALVTWLTEKGYAMSPEIEAWVKPYVELGWKITALKVAPKAKKSHDNTVEASALRLTFKTDRPLFPYREPDYKDSAKKLGAYYRVLRIYFVSDARYYGEFTPRTAWSGKPVWSNALDAAARQSAIASLGVPEASVPAQWWMTEFEDEWHYTVAPGDVYFARDSNQATLKRPPYINYIYVRGPVEATCIGFPIMLIALAVWIKRASNAKKS